MRTVSASNAHSVNNQCALHQQPMRIAPDSLMLGFSSPNISLYAISLSPLSFCVESKVKSQNPSSQKVPSLRVCGMIVLKDPSPSTREVILHLKEPSLPGRGGTACGG